MAHPWLKRLAPPSGGPEVHGATLEMAGPGGLRWPQGCRQSPAPGLGEGAGRAAGRAAPSGRGQQPGAALRGSVAASAVSRPGGPSEGSRGPCGEGRRAYCPGGGSCSWLGEQTLERRFSMTGSSSFRGIPLRPDPAGTGEAAEGATRREGDERGRASARGGRGSGGSRRLGPLWPLARALLLCTY